MKEDIDGQQSPKSARGANERPPTQGNRGSSQAPRVPKSPPEQANRSAEQPPPAHRGGKRPARQRTLVVRTRGDGLRTCIACGQEAPPAALIRLVAGPEGDVCVDIRRRQGGRGAHVCPDPVCIGAAVGKQRVARQLKEPVTTSVPALIASAQAQMRASVFFLLSLAQKAGRLVSGVEVVAKEAVRGSVQVIVVSSDIAPSSRAQLEEAAQRGRVAFFVLDCTGEELGHGIGRDVRVAVSVKSGELALGLSEELLRLVRLGRTS